ncbi:MAG: hypothetical protein VB119_03250 [Candidatus Metalachnospira sp.]|nr:hypothetical protein [Candidatus Metalachnospira sp.]
MKLLDIFLNIIGILVVIEYIHYIVVTVLWNFKYGHSLVIKNTQTSGKIGTVIFLVAISYVSSILKIILVTALFISALVLYKYIEVQNKTINKNNLELQSFYISEIKKEIRNDCIAISIFYVIIIIVSNI